MSSSSKNVTFIVSAPFDSDPGADVLLLSCDNFTFQARKAILTLASPVFGDMFSLPQPPSNEVNDDSSAHNPPLPSVRLSETGPVIDVLLRYCYPVEPPRKIQAFDIVRAVRCAAEKYDMAFIATKVDGYILASNNKDPAYSLLLYRNACEQQKEGDARLYARDCLKLPYASLVRYWPSQVLDKSLTNLIYYHQAISQAVGATITSTQYTGACDLIRNQFCNSCYVSFGSVRQPKWWQKYLTSCLQNINNAGNGLSLEHMRLRGEDAGRELCQSCGYKALCNWETLGETLNKIMEEETKKARITFSILIGND